MSLVQYNISFIGTSADPNSREDGFFEEVGIPRSLWWDKKTMLMYKTLLFVIFWMVSLIYIYIYTVVVYPGISTKSSDTNTTFVLREESTWFQTWLGQKKLSNDVCFTSGNATIKCHDFSLMLIIHMRRCQIAAWQLASLGSFKHPRRSHGVSNPLSFRSLLPGLKVEMVTTSSSLGWIPSQRRSGGAIYSASAVSCELLCLDGKI